MTSCCRIGCYIVSEESDFRVDDAKVMFGFTYGPAVAGPDGTQSTPRENIISGHALSRAGDEQSPIRLKKYESRGFTFSGITAKKEVKDTEKKRHKLMETYESSTGAVLPEVEHLDLQPAARPDQPLLSNVPGTGLSILTWNIDGMHLDDSKIDDIVAAVLARSATIVCLQEVSISGFRRLKEASQLQEHGYAVYGIMDQEYVEACEVKSGRRAYGLAFLTQMALQVQSFAFEPNKDTFQSRRFDIAYAGELAILNLHAESNQSNLDRNVSEQRRIRQFEIATNVLRAGMEEKGILAGLLCGDLNTGTGSEGDIFLHKHYVDVNMAGAVCTLAKATKSAHKFIQYYDRIMQLKPGRLCPQANWSACPTTSSDHSCVSCVLDFNDTASWHDATYRPAGVPAMMPVMTRTFTSAKRCFRVVLTGGPCSGKTSALAAIRSKFQRMGYQVMVVPEAATQVLDGCGGFDPAWVGTPRALTFQGIIARAAIVNEDQAEALSTLRDKPAIMICDRGVPDGRAFCSAAQWSKILSEMNVTQQELFARYDKVLHLETVAMYEGGKYYEYGEGSNNPSRFHTPEAAAENCKGLGEVYSSCGEDKYCYIANAGSFEDKIRSALQQLVDGVRHKSCCSPRARKSVSVAQLAFTAGGEVEGGLLDLSTHDDISELQMFETIVTAVGSDVEVREQRALHVGTMVPPCTDSDFEIRYSKIRGKRRIVAAREARETIAASNSHKSVRKLSYCFVSGGRYYELIQYQQPNAADEPAWTPSWPGCMTLDFETPVPGQRASVLAWLGDDKDEDESATHCAGGSPTLPPPSTLLRAETLHALQQVGTGQ